MQTSFLARSIVGEGLSRASWTRGVLMLGVVLLLSFTAKADHVREYEFDIPQQGIETALSTLATQAGALLLFPYDLVQPVDSKPVSGRYTVEDALAILLEGTGLTGGLTEGGVVTISRVGAIDNQGRTTMGQNDKNSNGSKAPTKRRGLFGVLAVVFSAGVGAQDVADVDEEELRIEEIVVTGTNIRGVENPTVPVLTFDKDDIDLSGAATVDDFLRTIPQNFASETQLTAESGLATEIGTRNRTQGTAVDLRGLGPGSTLTLLNGRRMTVTGEGTQVDINVLPLGAIERVDVLTDGASAIYGSDAVGGAINFVTRRDYEGFDINARYGTVTEGSREDFGIGAAGGFKWGSGGVFAGLDYQQQKPLLVEERDFIDLSRAREGATLGSDSDRYSIAGGVNQNLGASTRFGVDILYSDLTNESFSLTEFNPVRAKSEQSALFINSRLEYDLTSDIIASVFFDYGRNKVANSRLTPNGSALPSVEFENESYVYEGQLSGQLLDISGGPVSFSLGGLYRTEELARRPDGVSDIATDRDVAAVYTEVLVPIIGDKNSLPFAQRFELSFAGRYEDYSDIGDSFTPKIGAYWALNEDFSLRASYSESFRAPDLTSLNAEEIFAISGFPSSSFTAVNAPTPLPNAPFPGAIFIILPNGGNPNLGPESAKTWSAGFTYEPQFVDGLTLQGNFFDIQYIDRLEGVGILDTIQDPAFAGFVDIPPDLDFIESIFARAATGDLQLSNFFGASPQDIQVLFRSGFQNIAERDVSGFDITANFTRDTDLGRFSAGANASYFVDYIARPTAISTSTEQVDTLYRPVDFRLRGSLAWSKDAFTAFAAVNYTDNYRDNPDRSISNSIDSWTTVDMSFAYDASDKISNAIISGTRFGVSITNLLDEDPPFVSTPFGLNYDSANANPFGRQINLTLSKSF